MYSKRYNPIKDKSAEIIEHMQGANYILDEPVDTHYDFIVSEHIDKIMSSPYIPEVIGYQTAPEKNIGDRYFEASVKHGNKEDIQKMYEETISEDYVAGPEFIKLYDDGTLISYWLAGTDINFMLNEDYYLRFSVAASELGKDEVYKTCSALKSLVSSGNDRVRIIRYQREAEEQLIKEGNEIGDAHHQ